MSMSQFSDFFPTFINHLSSNKENLDLSSTWGIFQHMTYSEHARCFGVEFCTVPRFLVETFGVKFGVVTRFFLTNPNVIFQIRSQESYDYRSEKSLILMISLSLTLPANLACNIFLL